MIFVVLMILTTAKLGKEIILAKRFLMFLKSALHCKNKGNILIFNWLKPDYLSIKMAKCNARWRVCSNRRSFIYEKIVVVLYWN